MPPELLIDDQHGYIGLALLILADDAADDPLAVVSHDCEFGELRDEVVVGED